MQMVVVVVAAWKHPHRRGEDLSRPADDHPGRETPPQAWGRLLLPPAPPLPPGNTPTGVGKTEFNQVTQAAIQKHPHRRGEDCSLPRSPAPWSETPPQAWGRHYPNFNPLNRSRNTPTGVGKTVCVTTKNGPLQKHPHRRGEDLYWNVP